METLAQDLTTMVRTPLHDEHVEQLHKLGTKRSFKAGETVLEMGDRQTHFYYMLEGEMEALLIDGQRYGEATLGPTQFVGEIGFLHNGRALMAIRAVQDSEVIAVEREAMLGLMSQVPSLSDIIVTVFAARRRAMLERQNSSLTIVGADQDPNVQRVAAFASRNRIPFRNLELGDPETSEVLATCSALPDAPAVIYGKGEVVEDPTPQRVARLIGVDMEFDRQDVFDVLIVGGGPAGIAAAVYAGSEGLCALVVEDLTIGGQAGTSSRIENYMGFPTGISGADLCWRGEIQAMKFGTRFAMPRRAVALERIGDVFCVTLDTEEQICARTIVISTGVQYRKLPLDRLEDFEGAGVYYAATDLESRYCRNQEVVVVGGGNSAGQAAMFLARHAKHVHVLVRGDSLASSMSSYLSSRLDAHSHITIHYHTEVEALHGDRTLDGVTLRDNAAETSERVGAKGLFIMIGAAPNTSWLGDAVDLDEKGFVCTGMEVGGRSTFETSTHGMFAVGDVRAGSVKRVASGVGEGSVVISHVWQHVDDLKSKAREHDA